MIGVIVLLFIICIIVHISFIKGLLSVAIYRFFIFWFACIPARTLLAWLAHNGHNITPITTCIGIGMLYKFITEQHKKNKGGKMNQGAFGNTPYWHNARLIHGVLFLLYSVYNNAYILYADVVVGIVTKILYN